MVAFERALQDAFVVQMARHLRTVVPEIVARFEDAAFMKSVSTRMARAFSYGLTDRFDVRRYLECSYLLGWTDEAPDGEACAVFAQEGVMVEEKMDLIEQRTERL